MRACWPPAFAPEELARAVIDYLENLGLEVLEVVNLRLMFDVHGPAEGSLDAPLEAVAAASLTLSQDVVTKLDAIGR